MSMNILKLEFDNTALCLKIRPTMILSLNFLFIMKQCHHNTRVCQCISLYYFLSVAIKEMLKVSFVRYIQRYFLWGYAKKVLLQGA